MVSDEQLVEQLKKGKTRALDELYARYAKPLYVFCAHSSRTKDPEDVVHDVFVTFIRSCGKLRITENLKGYLATCVANHVRNKNKARQKYLSVVRRRNNC